MAQTIFGTQGTVSEAQWAELMSLSTQKYVRDSIALPTMLPNTSAPTSLRFPPFKSVGAGVLVKEDTNVTINTPSGAVVGRWYLLVLRRTWGLSPTATLTWIATTSSAATPPTAFPAGRQVIPGVTDDEPVGWYQHRAGGSPAVWVSLSALADGVVNDRAALWDGAEQGFTHARVLRAADVESQWTLGMSEFFIWNPATSKWEPRGTDTITMHMSIIGLQAPVGGGVIIRPVDFFGDIFEVPPMVTMTPITTVPQNMSCGAMNITTSGFDLMFYRTSNTDTNVRVMVTGIPKRS